jgi:hypothetical protein
MDCSSSGHSGACPPMRSSRLTAATSPVWCWKNNAIAPLGVDGSRRAYVSGSGRLEVAGLDAGLFDWATPAMPLPGGTRRRWQQNFRRRKSLRAAGEVEIFAALFRRCRPQRPVRPADRFIPGETFGEVRPFYATAVIMSKNIRRRLPSQTRYRPKFKGSLIGVSCVAGNPTHSSLVLIPRVAASRAGIRLQLWAGISSDRTRGK